MLNSSKNNLGNGPELEEKHELMENGKSISDDSDIPERETWGRKLEFMLACVGYAVGLGNVWRFPYLTFKNGGGAFLIPYFIMLVLCGMPLFFLELALGQYFSLGPVTSWNALCPLAKGVGFSMLMVSFLCCIYYNVIIAWVLYYMVVSFKSTLLWESCGQGWSTETCAESAAAATKVITNCSIISSNSSLSNATVATTNYITTLSTLNSTIQSTIPDGFNISKCTNTTVVSDFDIPTKQFWENFILEITSGIDNAGGLRWQLVVALIVAWVLVYLCLFKGIKSSGKVVYFTATFPYMLMCALLVRGATLPGAAKGLEFYLKPDFAKLADAKVWVSAASQIFYSLGIGFGSLITFGSYNKFNNNCVKDAITVSLINCFTSVFAGAATFCVLGYMAEKLGKEVQDVATEGPGLVFVVYPEGIAKMPIAPVWAVLFFFMVLTLGLDTQFAMLEAVITGLSDEYPKVLRKYKMLFIAAICLICLLLGLPLVSQGGMYILNMFDLQSGGFSLLFLALFEVLAVAYGYGADRFEEDIASMLGHRPSRWWKWCWKYFSPTIILVVLLFSVAQWQGMSYGKYRYPNWAEAIGWMIALSSMLFIPGVAIYKIWQGPGSFKEKVLYALQPDRDAQHRVELQNNLILKTENSNV